MHIAGSVSKRYLFIEGLLILSLSYLLLLDAGNQSLSIYPINLISAIFFSLITLIWLFYGQKGGNPLVLPAAIWMIVSLVSTVLSIDPRRSISELLMSSIAIFIFFMIYDLVAWRWPQELLIKCLLIVGAIAMVFSWIGVIDFYSRWWAISDGKLFPPIAFRLSAPNVQAWNFNPLVMLALANLLFAKSKIARWGLGLYILSGLALIFFSSSRGGWIGTGAGFVLLAYIYGHTRKTELLSFWNRLKVRRILMSLIILGGVALFAVAGYVLYLQTIHPSHSSFIGARIGFWSTAIKTIGQNLVIGQGPYTFISALISDHSVPNFGVYMHAHSLPLTITSETGFLGMAASLLLFITVTILLWRRFKQSPVEKIPIIASALAALTAASIHSLFDSFIGKSFGSWVVIIAIAAALSLPSKTEGRTSRPWFALIVALALWAVVWVSYPMAAGQAHAANNDWQSAAQDYREALRRDAFSAAPYQQLGLAESMVGDNHNLVIKAFKEAIHLDPFWALNHANLGAIFLSESDYVNAQTEFRTAAAQAPLSELYNLNYAYASEMTGDVMQAADAYRIALGLQPAWATSSFWQGSEFRKVLIAAWLKDHPDPKILTQNELEVAAHDAPYETTYDNLLAWYAIKNGDLDKAQYWIDLADLVATSVPYSKAETAWLHVEIAAANGDSKKAVELGKNVFLMFTSPGVSGPGDQEGSYYTGSAFRTPVMDRALVPQMVTLLPDVWEQRFVMLNNWIVKNEGSENSIIPELSRLAPYLKMPNN